VFGRSQTATPAMRAQEEDSRSSLEQFEMRHHLCLPVKAHIITRPCCRASEVPSQGPKLRRRPSASHGRQFANPCCSNPIIAGNKTTNPVFRLAEVKEIQQRHLAVLRSLWVASMSNSREAVCIYEAKSCVTPLRKVAFLKAENLHR
jgi:hypothetical protein